MAMTRMFTLILSAILIASIGEYSHVGATHSASQPTVDASGRLGGSRDSFQVAYADRHPEVTGSGTLFTFDDLGLFLVSFQGRTREPQPYDIAAVIIISAPRDPGTAAESSDANDWTMDEAQEIARHFLPTDALVELNGTPGTDQPPQPTCQSDLITSTDFGSGAGSIGCQVTFIQPTAESVSFLTLSLTDPKAPSVRQDPCAEMTAWVAATGGNMTDAEALIASIETLDLTMDDAGEKLRGIAIELGDLADRQTALVTPPPAARAQTSLIGALHGYVEALNLAADAIASGDDTVLERATALVTTARDDYETADDQMLVALRACSIATPST